jgi:dCMP deaminase
MYMFFAFDAAMRSSCSRMRVGVIIVNDVKDNVVAVGYNGSARGAPNTCDTTTPGSCGCLHAEINALIKADGRAGNVMYTTLSPCVACAKAIVNARIAHVNYLVLYRDAEPGLRVLTDAGVTHNLLKLSC